jgi:hypothetical protein
MFDALFAAVAEAVFNLLLQERGLTERVRAVLRIDPERRGFQIALARACSDFTQQHPAWAAALFDQHFLTQPEVVELLSRLLARRGRPDPARMAALWAAQLHRADPASRAEAATVAADFLRLLETELDARPELRALSESRDSAAVKDNTDTIAAEITALRRDLPGGEACYRLASALARARRCNRFADLAALGGDESFLTATHPPVGDPPAQRETWTTLERLRRAAQEAHTVQTSVSRMVRSQALNRALAAVNEILTGIEQIPRAEREPVRAIAAAWRDLLLNTAAEVGQAAPTKPVRNPYSIGDPVIGKGLVGRDDVLRRLEELWYGSASPPSVVIFGHRRMGKTSILRNLDGRLGSRVHVAYVNLLLPGSLRNGAVDLFVKLADSIADTLRHKQAPAPPIDDAAFERRPELAFERYLKQVGATLNEQRLIIALDEFERLEEWITNGRLPTDILKTLRSSIQMDERIAFAFAGLHTLEEMRSDYFQPFFAGVIPVKVSFLSRGAVDQALANPPDPEFALDYEREALDHIWELTGGQPYLVQLIGHRLVSRFNTLSFEQGKAQEPRFRRADVEAVITTDFYDQARSYFTGVWGQAQHGAPEQQTMLRCLAPHPDGLPRARLCAISGLPERTVDQALQTLCRHDVVHELDGQWRYTVELFRRWVEQGRGGDLPLKGEFLGRDE